MKLYPPSICTQVLTICAKIQMQHLNFNKWEHKHGTNSVLIIPYINSSGFPLQDLASLLDPLYYNYIHKNLWKTEQNTLLKAVKLLLVWTDMPFKWKMHCNNFVNYSRWTYCNLCDRGISSQQQSTITQQISHYAFTVQLFFF